MKPLSHFHKNELMDECLYVNYDKANTTYDFTLRKVLSSSRKTRC